MKRIYFVCLFLCLTTTFLLCQSNPIPLINQPLVPSSVEPGSSGLTLTVNGTGFVSTSAVNWNGTPLSTTYVNVRKLQAEVPGSGLVSASTALVTVSNPGIGVGTSNAVFFTITVPTSSLAFATSTIPVGINPGAVVVADFNNDGKPDLAIVNQKQPDEACYTPDRGNIGTISILLGNGDGTFVNKSTSCFTDIGLGDYAGPQLVAGDFNGDGKTDLVASFIASGRVSFTAFLGNGDGTFTSSGTFGGFDGIGEVIAADFNRDGMLDLASPATVLDYMAIFTFLGNGDGTFACCGGYGYLPAHGSLATGDFNNDGILDVAVTTFGSVTILLGNGDGSFTPAASQPSATMVNPASVTTADFNRDGVLDLAIADAGSAALTILIGKGDGTFTQVSGEPSLTGFSNFVTAADLNGDGKLDLVFSGEANTISMFLGNGDGTFRAGLTEAMDYAPYGIAAGDFNGDGRLDLAVTNSSDNTVSILLQRPPRSGVTITLASGQNPITINEPVTYTVVVWDSPTMPTGSVTLEQGPTVLGTAPLANGQASFTTAFTTPGTFPIIARYSGDENYGAKNSQVVKQVVTKYATYEYLYSDPNPSVYGQAVSLQCFVDNEQPNPPTGTVTFKNGPFSLGTAPLVNGTALLTKTNLPAGTTVISAIYNGDASNSKSTSSRLLSQLVNQATTTTTLTSSPNPSAPGQKVKFTATVTSQTVVPVGTVTFSVGTTTLGTVTLAGGKASLTTAALPALAAPILVTATYNETSNFSGSSGRVVQTIR
jgi:Bacterial Ig-like domain (group 3)/FG-GAP-like repeat